MTTPDSEFHPFPETARDRIDAQLRSAVQPARIPRQPRNTSQMVAPTLAHDELPEPPEQWRGTSDVPVTSPPVTPTASALGTSIPLPSQYFWYPFSDLYVSPLRVVHLAKINAANETGNLQPLVEVVASLLHAPGFESLNVANMLCVQDWTSILYHLKFTSFNKRGVNIEWECNDEEHLKAHNFWANMSEDERVQHESKIAKLAEADKAQMTPWYLKPPPTLRNKASVDQTTLRTNYLKSAPDPAVYRIDLKGKIPSCATHARLRPETVLDTIQFMDIPGWEDDHELQWLAQQVTMIEVLRPDGTEYSLPERIEMLRSEQLELTTDEFTLLQEFIELGDTFGVEEFVKVRCMGCGASTQVKAYVDASTFLTKGV